MTTIYKHPIQITDVQEITMPTCACILDVGMDPSGQPCVWAEVNTDLPPIKWTLFIVGTGHPLPEQATNHIGSFVQGPFVWHAYI